MILIISTCKEKLHELEFVKPIEKILEKNKTNFSVKHYSKVSESDSRKADKVIISGTALRDFDYVNSLENFVWIKNFEKPILGICAGLEILVLVFGGKLKKKQEIGMKKVFVEKSFLGMKKDFEGYFLHNLSVKKNKNFEVFAKTEKTISAIKFVDKDFFGVFFHPEVRNENLIIDFVSQ